MALSAPIAFSAPPDKAAIEAAIRAARPNQAKLKRELAEAVRQRQRRLAFAGLEQQAQQVANLISAQQRIRQGEDATSVVAELAASQKAASPIAVKSERGTTSSEPPRASSPVVVGLPKSAEPGPDASASWTLVQRRC